MSLVWIVTKFEDYSLLESYRKKLRRGGGGIPTWELTKTVLENIEIRGKKTIFFSTRKVRCE